MSLPIFYAPVAISSGAKPFASERVGTGEGREDRKRLRPRAPGGERGLKAARLVRVETEFACEACAQKDASGRL